jgi:hypothetical protein
MNVDSDTFKFDNREHLLPLNKKMKMNKKIKGEIMHINSSKRRKTETSGSYMGSLAISKFEDGAISPCSNARNKGKRKLYLKKRNLNNKKVRNINLKEKPFDSKKKKTKSRLLNKAHKKNLSHNLRRDTPTKLKDKQIATPKTIAYKKLSDKSSTDQRNQKSLNKVSSELIYDFGIGTNDSKTLKDSETENNQNYFEKFKEKQNKFDKRLQEDKDLLNKKENQKNVIYKDEETKSEEEKREETVGLVNRIKKELLSERGEEFKKILQKFINEDQLENKVNNLKHVYND